MYLGMYKKIHEKNHNFFFGPSIFFHIFLENGQNWLRTGSKGAQLPT